MPLPGHRFEKSKTMSVVIRQLDSADKDFQARLMAVLAFEASEDEAIDRAAAAIIADVRQRGDVAVLEYSLRFDRLTATGMPALEISRTELKAALDSLAPERRAALQAAADRHQLRRRARARRKALPAYRVRAALPRVEEQHQHTETALRNAVGVEILFREGKGLVARPQEMQKHFTRGGVQIGKGLRRTQQALVAGKVFQHQEWHGPKGLGAIRNIRKLIIRRLIIETSDLCRFRGEKIPNPSFK